MAEQELVLIGLILVIVVCLLFCLAAFIFVVRKVKNCIIKGCALLMFVNVLLGILIIAALYVYNKPGLWQEILSLIKQGGI